jgi:hypothetical protein
MHCHLYSYLIHGRGRPRGDVKNRSCTVNIRKSGSAVGVEWNCKIELNCVVEEMRDRRWVKVDHKKGNNIEDPRV